MKEPAKKLKFDNAVISRRDLEKALTKGAKKVKLFMGVRITARADVPEGTVVFRSGRVIVGVKAAKASKGKADVKI